MSGHFRHDHRQDRRRAHHAGSGEPPAALQSPGCDDEHVHTDDHHSPGHSATTRAFALGTLINLAFTAVEAGYGLMTGSLALLSDALHNLGDALGLALAWAAAHLAQRPASARRTYGYRRATVLAPLANSLVLVGGAGALAWEAMRRFDSPPAVDSTTVMIVAAVGIGVNLGSALLFRHGHAHDINQRGAYLHLLADAGVSLAVVVGAAGMLLFGWRWLDPLLALAIGAFVAWSSWGLLRDSLDLALDAVPRGIDQDDVVRFLATQPGVCAVHHLHIWALGSRETALTAHLVRAEDDRDNDEFLWRTAQGLKERFGIAHATLQVERGDSAECAPCP